MKTCALFVLGLVCLVGQQSFSAVPIRMADSDVVQGADGKLYQCGGSSPSMVNHYCMCGPKGYGIYYHFDYVNVSVPAPASGTDLWAATMQECARRGFGEAEKCDGKDLKIK